MTDPVEYIRENWFPNPPHHVQLRTNPMDGTRLFRCTVCDHLEDNFTSTTDLVAAVKAHVFGADPEPAVQRGGLRLVRED